MTWKVRVTCRECPERRGEPRDLAVEYRNIVAYVGNDKRRDFRMNPCCVKELDVSDNGFKVASEKTVNVGIERFDVDVGGRKKRDHFSKGRFANHSVADENDGDPGVPERSGALFNKFGPDERFVVRESDRTRVMQDRKMDDVPNGHLPQDDRRFP